jgi:hypothetical protein
MALLVVEDLDRHVCVTQSASLAASMMRLSGSIAPVSAFDHAGWL